MTTLKVTKTSQVRTLGITELKLRAYTSISLKIQYIIICMTEFSEDELERQRGILRHQEVQGDDSFEGK